MSWGALVLGVLVSLVGCGYPSLPKLASDAGAGSGVGNGVDVDGGASGDGALSGDVGAIADGPTVPGDACVSFSSQFDTCAILASLATDVRIGAPGVAGVEYDTDTHVLTVDGVATDVPHMTIVTKGQMVDAILGHNVFVVQGVVLRANGKLPFAIVASGSIQLEQSAMINAAAGGAGALDSCSAPALPGTNAIGGAGGGGGGGYGAAGGAGGPGNKDGGKVLGGAAGFSFGPPPGPQGGCPGGKGGNGGVPLGIGGAGGLGGGAIYLLAADTIRLGDAAVLNASGGGGKGGAASAGQGDAGGGGGGSGGMVWLEAPHVVGTQSQIAANGGGGGEGSNAVTAGANGHDGGASVARAGGGRGEVDDAADGGAGGSDGALEGDSVTELQNGGGGGGGGGVGYIRVVSPDFQPGVVSPAATN